MPEISSEVVTQDTRTIAVLMWIGTLIFSFVPSLVLFLVKKDDSYLQDQSKEALNWSITLLIGWIVGYMLLFILIGFVVLPIVAVCDLVFCILGAVAASNGKRFRVPFAIRLLK